MEEQNGFSNTFNQRVGDEIDWYSNTWTAVIFHTSAIYFRHVALNAAFLRHIQKLSAHTFATTPAILYEICFSSISQHPYTQLLGRNTKLRHECSHILYTWSFTNTVSFCVYRDTPLTASWNKPQINTAKPVKLTTFIRWPPTDVDHISLEPAKSNIRPPP